MIYINITNFVLISSSMIETRRLKNVIIFLKTILSLVLSRKISWLFSALVLEVLRV